MNETIRHLEPAALWNYFADLNAVPRPSKKEEKVIAFIRRFGEKLGLPTTVDEAGNVIIKKPATKGMEDRVTVVLQSHLDMVHQKNAATDFDFDTQGIEMFVDGDWVKASGTTLGADNGIGVSAIMTLLASSGIPHPALEALFTIDEETGMTGALSLKGGLLDGKILLNLDTEDDRELTIGCAGGVDVTATGTYTAGENKGAVALKLSLKGLTGGHSGMDIHKGRGNANKLMNRVLSDLNRRFDFRISSIDGGSLRNAIPRESVCVISAATGVEQGLTQAVADWEQVLKAEYAVTDPQLSLSAAQTDAPQTLCSKEFQDTFLRSIYACPNGIYRMSPDIAGLVQTSNNLARVLLKDGTYQVQCLTRSSVDTEKTDLQDAVASAFELAGAKVAASGAYPGWTPRPGSAIVQLMSDLYKEKYGEEALVSACHAGLECGILGTNYPGMQMISFGPNITGAHSPDEKVQVSSVQKFWAFLLETLHRIPASL